MRVNMYLGGMYVVFVCDLYICIRSDYASVDVVSTLEFRPIENI